MTYKHACSYIQGIFQELQQPTYTHTPTYTNLSLFAVNRLTHNIREDVRLVSSWLQTRGFPQTHDHSGADFSLITRFVAAIMQQYKDSAKKILKEFVISSKLFLSKVKSNLSSDPFLLSLSIKSPGREAFLLQAFHGRFIWPDKKSWKVLKYSSPLPLHKRAK